jgi:excisionase family DNA binding protein
MRNTALEQYISIKDVADSLAIAEQTAYRWVRSGRLPSVRLGDRVLIPLDALKKMLANNAQAQKGGV